jgi:hypothetical protein
MHELLQPDVIGPLVSVPVCFFTALAVIIAVMHFRSRAEQARHAMVRFMVEQGRDVPKELLAPPRRPSSLLLRGLVLLAAGIGLGVALLLAGERDIAGFGIIPALVGIAFLVTWRVESGRTEAEAAAANAPR